MKTQALYYLDGKVLPADKTCIPVNNLGLIRGYGLFESLRTYDRKPFLLKPHLKRLYRAVAEIGLKIPLAASGLELRVMEMIRRNPFENALIRILVTGGPSMGLLPAGQPTVLIMLDEFHPFPEWQYQRGIKLKTTSLGRIHPNIKTTVYFSAVLETQRALRKGFHEVVYLDAKRQLLEGTTFNLIGVLPGPKLMVAKDAVLPGITLDCVLKIAKKLNIPVVRKPIPYASLGKLKEAFITSSNREIIPAIQIDKVRIGDGKPGPVTRRIHEVYGEMVAGCFLQTSSR
jgi:branched-chain amino acid aminotransferase